MGLGTKSYEINLNEYTEFLVFSDTIYCNGNNNHNQNLLHQYMRDVRAQWLECLWQRVYYIYGAPIGVCKGWGVGRGGEEWRMFGCIPHRECC